MADQCRQHVAVYGSVWQCFPPLFGYRLSGGSESTPQISPLKKNDVSSGIYGNSAQSRKRAHFQAQLETLMADGNEPSSSGPAQQHLQGRWPFYRRQEDGGVGFPEGEGGGQWMRKANQPPRRGRLRGGQLEVYV